MDFGKLNKRGFYPPASHIPVGRPIKLPKICETNTMVIVVCPADLAHGTSILLGCQDFVILTSAYWRGRHHTYRLEKQTLVHRTYFFLPCTNTQRTCKLDHIHSDSQNPTSKRANARNSSHNPYEAYEDSSQESTTQVLHKDTARKKLDTYVT